MHTPGDRHNSNVQYVYRYTFAHRDANTPSRNMDLQPHTHTSGQTHTKRHRHKDISWHTPHIETVTFSVA
jgi:hypothetical protein